MPSLTAREQDRLDRAWRLLADLPSVPDALQREVVAATLAAFEVSSDEIVAAASTLLAALNTELADRAADARRARDAGNERVSALEGEIAQVHAEVGRMVAQVEVHQIAARAAIEDAAGVIRFVMREALASLAIETAAPVTGGSRPRP